MYRYPDEMSPPHSSDRRPILPPPGSSSSTGAGSSSRSRIRAPVSPPPIHSYSHSGGSSSAHVSQSRSRYREVDPHRDDYPPPPSKHSDRYRDYEHDMHPPPPVSSSHSQHRYLPYKILCVANLNSKVSDGNIRDALIREFTRFGDVSVKVTHDANERFAYIYFRCYEDAREARHAKSRMILFDKLVEIDPIYERYPPVIPSSSSSSSSRRRSLTPEYPPPSSGYYSSSRRPVSPGSGYHYSSSSSSSSRRYPHPPPPASSSSSSSSSRVMIDRYGVPYMTHRPDYPRDHPSHGHHSSSRDDYPIRSSGSSSNHHISSNSSTSLTGGSTGPGNNGNSSSNNNNGSVRDASSSSRDAKSQRESKKEKFPNYLHHIPPEEDDKATRTLFVGNLEVTISEPELKRIFERYGVVEDIDVKRPQPGSGNAYAFIKYQNLDMAHRSKVEMSGQYIGKFQCKIGYGKATPTTRIWVGGLGPWTSLSALEREFDRFGAIRKIDFIRGENHAYISYDSIDAAQAACQEMRGFPLGGPGKRLRVDFADPGPFSCDGTSPVPGVTSDVAATATTRVVAPGEKFPDADADLSREDVKEEEDGDAMSGRNGQTWSDEERKNRKRTGLESPSDGLPSPKRLRDDEPSVRKSSEELPEEGLRSTLAPESAANLSELIDCCPSAWNGTLILKNSAFLTSMLHVSGDVRLVDSLMRTTTSTTAAGDHPATQRSTSSPQSQISAEPSVAGSSVDERPAATTAASSSPSSAHSPSGGASGETTEPTPVLRITQRLRLDPPKLDDVCRRMSAAGSQGHCMLLAIRAAVNCPQIGANGKILGDDATGEHEVVQRPFKNLVNYLKQKQAAGVIPLTSFSSTSASASAASTTTTDPGREMRGSLYAFPPCLFATELIQKVAPNFEDFDHKNEYLLVVVIRESSK